MANEGRITWGGVLGHLADSLTILRREPMENSGMGLCGVGGRGGGVRILVRDWRL